ncbi:hypothetical protein [Methylopila sp. 73B]|uniref:hypothetical protein n=1 Tax=Methylopila sp. 73B TaxID=1120792 RepID=UPI000367C4F2|nr:hypothetical protein [Methylopila sp. 73B]
MIRVSRLFRALALVAAYLLAVEGVVASAAASAHAGRMASVDGLAALCGAGPASTEDPAALCACDDLCRLPPSAVLDAASPAVGALATTPSGVSGVGVACAIPGAPRRMGMARGPPAPARPT